MLIHVPFLFVCFSPRASSGSTIGITTLSCPSCSTGWVSRCPAGSEKSWSTPGSRTTEGAHSSAHWTTTRPLLRGGDTGPSDRKGWRSQIVLKETEIFGARTQNLTVFFPNEQRMVSKKSAKLLSAADSSPLSPWASRYSPAGQTRTVDASMTPPLWSWRRRKRLSDTQERPSVFDNHTPRSP